MIVFDLSKNYFIYSLDILPNDFLGKLYCYTLTILIFSFSNEDILKSGLESVII